MYIWYEYMYVYVCMYVCMYVCVEMLSASIREFTVKDKTCFEVSAAMAGKKGMKKYVFAFERDGDKVGDDIHTVYNTYYIQTYKHTYIHSYIHTYILQPTYQSIQP